MSEQHNNQHEHKGLNANATRSFALLFCMGALAGVLIWAKLRLVTDIPRSAYADPRERMVDESDQETDLTPGEDRPEDKSHEAHP